MPMLRALYSIALALLFAGCASAPSSTPDLPVQDITVQGPPLGLDWSGALADFRGQPPQRQTLAAIEAAVTSIYDWADWREIKAQAAPVYEAQGRLAVQVRVQALPPGDNGEPPLAWQPPEEVVPPPRAAAGARPEPVLDAALSQWQQADSRVLIVRSERRLYLKRRRGDVVSYPVAVGTVRTPTPVGDYTVEGARENPTWYPPASIRRAYAARGESLPLVVPPGPGNPLGDWFVRLQRGIGIHGTNQPRSIGRAVSHGCVRMHDADVAQVAAELRRGDGVTVIHERAALIAQQ